MAHTRQSRPYSGLDFQVKTLKRFELILDRSEVALGAHLSEDARAALRDSCREAPHARPPLLVSLKGRSLELAVWSPLGNVTTKNPCELRQTAVHRRGSHGVLVVTSDC